MATEAQIKAQAKYDAANTRQVHLKLNRRTDKDVLARLDEVPSKQGYIKRLIREDLERARRSDSLYYDTQVTNRRALCDMIANLESVLAESKAENAKLREENVRLRSCLSDDVENARMIMGENAKLRELVAEIYEDQCDNSERWRYRDRMRELGIELNDCE